ncbi:MAG: NADH-ubiquinone oxidoreductase-F iron-sulfur binding region domain-containing protein [Phycisphaerae bacterium]
MKPEEFKSWREEQSDLLSLRIPGSGATARGSSDVRKEILVCVGGGCVSCGADNVTSAFEDRINASGLHADVKTVKTGCVGCCDLGVVIQIMPDDIMYRKVTVADVETIVQKHLSGQRVVDELLHRSSDDENADIYHSTRDMPFFQHQQKIVLENCGVIDPEVIEEYVACDGYVALVEALTERTPAEVLEEVRTSGLRGRGGGGFPVGAKWTMLAEAKGSSKHVICNADEGDPGAFMDRSVLESDPHRVLEGMLLAGYATGATHGVIYVRAEYPLAIQRLRTAIEQARTRNLLGDNILETPMCFDIEIRVGAGAFVCGEETALMASVEGQRGTPRPRPPYPTQSGLSGEPTIINNVETFANIPPIVRRGGAWYKAIGTEKSSGTKVFALAGAIRNTGLVEVPMGTSLRSLVFDIGGGVPDGRDFKAAQTGGPSGGCIPAAHLDTPLDFDSLQAIGSIMGSGGLIVMDDSSCMVDVARFFMEFCVDESCGKCPPCRVGTTQLLHMLNKICEGEAGEAEIERLEGLADLVMTSSLCGLGMTAPNPVLSTIRHFRAEYDAHIHDHRCPAGVCRKLLTFTIEREACTGCSLCARNCPVEVIHKYDDEKKYWIDTDPCIHCGQCFDVCRFDAVMKE